MLRAINKKNTNVKDDVSKMAVKPGADLAKLVKGNENKTIVPKVSESQTKSEEENKGKSGDAVTIKCTEFAEDIHKYLVHHDKKYILDENFLVGGEPTNKMRRILVDWLQQVHVRFHLLPETLHLTIYILDKMLAKKVTPKSELQLLGIACLFIAAKFEEIYAPEIRDYEFITENSFNKNQILQMEQTILSAIQFDLSCPSSIIFARYISATVSEKNGSSNFDSDAYFYTYSMSKYIGEFALVDSIMSSVPRSHIALAAMTIALELLPVRGINPITVEKKLIKAFGVTLAENNDTVHLLAQVVVKHLKQTKLVALKAKYQSNKLGAVANLIDDSAMEKLESMGHE